MATYTAGQWLISDGVQPRPPVRGRCDAPVCLRDGRNSTVSLLQTVPSTET